MKAPIYLLSLSLFASGVTAHYYWPFFIANGTQFPQWKYVRFVAGPTEYGSDTLFDKAEPHYDILSTNFTCGRSAFAYAKTTETTDVVAGSVIGFQLNQGNPDAYANSVRVNSALYEKHGLMGMEFAYNRQPSTLQHPGLAQAYLARVLTGTAMKDFSGIDGSWFKIASILAKTDTEWIAGDLSHRRIDFKLPETTPPGEYLLRLEQFMPSAKLNKAQFYFNCAQINVINKGAVGSLDGYPFAKFPGTYDAESKGVLVSQEIEDGRGLLKYVRPGPAVWKA